jgi:glycosyltransferase involved in cell wall biosynthesis
VTYPLITAAITAYNAEEMISDAIRSAVMQDWPRLEIIIVDDCSTDSTAAIIATIIHDLNSLDRPIRLIRLLKNGGVAQARNMLLSVARGEFLAFFDDDDISVPSRISRQFERIVEAEGIVGHDLVLCHTARQQIFSDGRSYYEGTMGCEGAIIPTGPEIVDRILFGRISPGVLGSCATCSQMARISVYRRLGEFDVNLRRAEDTDLNIRCGMQRGAIVGLAEALVAQSMTIGSEKSLFAELDAYTALHDKYRDFLSEAGWYDFTLRWRSIRRAHLEHRGIQATFLALLLAFRYPVKMVQRLYWSLPARRTRRRQRNWYHSAFRDVAKLSRPS